MDLTAKYSARNIGTFWTETSLVEKSKKNYIVPSHPSLSRQEWQFWLWAPNVTAAPCEHTQHMRFVAALEHVVELWCLFRNWLPWCLAIGKQKTRGFCFGVGRSSLLRFVGIQSLREQNRAFLWFPMWSKAADSEWPEARHREVSTQNHRFLLCDFSKSRCFSRRAARLWHW